MPAHHIHRHITRQCCKENHTLHCMSNVAVPSNKTPVLRSFLLIISIQSSYILLHSKERRFLKKYNTQTLMVTLVSKTLKTRQNFQKL